MIKYMAHATEPYLNKSFKTENSIWTIDSEGRIKGDSYYFIKHPEMKDAIVKYIGGITVQNLIKIYNDSITNKELEKRIYNALMPVSTGHCMIIGASPKDGLEKIFQIHTSKITELL